MIEKDARLTENIRQVLDQSLDDLDGATVSRLTRARCLAVARRRAKPTRFFYWGSVPVAGLILLVLLLNWPAAPVQPVAAPVLSELSIFTAAEPLEFYQEEIEFYEWLSEVLETEKELSGHVNSQPAVSVSAAFTGWGLFHSGASECRAARLSGVI